jgi:hypothetical protein
MSRYAPLNKSFSKLRKFPWVYHNLKKIYSFQKQKWQYIKNRLKRVIKKRFLFSRRKGKKKKVKYKSSAFLIDGITSREFNTYSNFRITKPTYKKLLENRQFFRYLYGHNRFKFYRMKKLSRLIVKKSSNEKISINYSFVKYLERSPVIVLLRQGLVRKFTDADLLVKRKLVKNENKFKLLNNSCSFSLPIIKIDALTLWFVYPFFLKNRLSLKLKRSLIKLFIKRFLNIKLGVISQSYIYYGLSKSQITLNNNKIFGENSFSKDLRVRLYSQTNKNSVCYPLTFKNLTLLKLNSLFFKNLKKDISLNTKNIYLIKTNYLNNFTLSCFSKKSYLSCYSFSYSHLNKSPFDLNSKIKKMQIDKQNIYSNTKNLYSLYLLVSSLKFKNNTVFNSKNKYKGKLNKKFLKKRHKSDLIYPFESHYEVNFKMLAFCYLNNFTLITKKKKELLPANLGVMATHLSY